MPELPEVEIVVRGLKSVVLNRTIENVKLFRTKLRRDINTSFIKDISGVKIINIRRIAKYIVIDLSNKKSIIFHLGMTGQLTVEKNKKDLKKHSHIVMDLDKDISIIYNDVRRFGLALTVATDDVEKHSLIKALGIEPLSPSFTGKALHEILQNKSSNIKTALLNQKLVCGIGNIYACEALFYARISPIRPANNLNINECKKLCSEIKKILEKSIKSGGSTLKDYVQSDGSKGSFQNQFSVYGQEGKTCKICDNVIQKIKQGGRSTFYCKKCQR